MGRSGLLARWLPVPLIAGLLGALPSTTQAQLNFPFHMGVSSNRFELSDAVHLDEADSATKTHLERVRAFLANRQWDEAVETLRQVMEEHGGQVVKVELRATMRPYLHVTELGYNLRHYLSLRDYCQVIVSELPAEALRLYRDRVDSQAKRLYDDAISQRDHNVLRMVVEQFFASSYGDDAMLALGDWALEQADYGAARGCYEQLLPAKRWEQLLGTRPERRPPWLIYPDTDLDPAAIDARLVLVSILEGSTARAKAELDRFRQEHPLDQGRLGGREAKFADTLTTLYESMTAWSDPPIGPDWPTFAGSTERTHATPQDIDVGAIRWRQSLPKTPPADATSIATRRVGEERGEPLSYHPLVLGDLLLVNTQYEIRAYRAATGEPAWGQDPVIYRDEESNVERRGNRPALGTPRYTMTVRGSKLFARMGNPITGNQAEQLVPLSSGYLVCIDLAAEGKLIWKREPPEDRWAFEGSPVCDDEHLYVGMRRGDVRPQSHVACYDIRNGAPVWRRLVASAETPAQGQVDEITHNLLTLHEGTLFYNTNLGAVAAVEARDGHLLWVTIYPRAKSGDLTQRATHFYRDLTPCVYDHGRLFVAPSDTPPIFALDARTGLLLWETGPAQEDTPIHLLGVGGGHLWASGAYLWWIDTETGVRHYWPRQGTDLKSLGRGMLAGGKVYWPTSHEIHVFDQQTGQRVRQPIELRMRGSAADQLHGGNLLVTDGLLFLLTGNKLFAIDQHSGQRLADEKMSSTPQKDEQLARRPATVPAPAPAEP